MLSTAALYENCKKSFINLAFAKEILVQQDKNGIGEDAVSVVVADGCIYAAGGSDRPGKRD